MDDDKPSVLTQLRYQSQTLGIKRLLGVSVFEKIEELLIQLVISIHIAFTIVENPAFQALLNMFSSTLASWTPSNGNILRSWITKAFHNREILLAEELRQAKSNIHLSFDMWTSSSSLAFVAVVAHYIGDNMKLQITLIG